MYLVYMKSTLRYYAYLCCYSFDDEKIISECCSKERMKDSKKLSHVAIVVNNLQEYKKGEQVSKLKLKSHFKIDYL